MKVSLLRKEKYFMSDTEISFEKIQELFSKAEYDIVKPLLKKYLSLHTDNPTAYKLYGNTFAYTGYLNKARLVWRGALKKFPENTDFLYNLALSGVLSGKPAKIYLKKLLKINPKDADAISLLAQIAKDNGNYKLAIKYWNTALSITPDNVEYMNNIGLSYAILESFGKASLWYKKALAIDENYALAYYNLSCAQFEIGEYEEAKKNAEKSMELDPTTHANQAMELINKIKQKI